MPDTNTPDILDSLPAVLRDLEPAKRTFCLLRAQGYPASKSLKAAGYTGHHSTADNWQASDWWIPAFKAACELVISRQLDAINPLIPLALGAYRYQLERNHHAGLAQDVLDRAWGKPVQVVNQRSQQSISIHIDCGGMLPEAMQACPELAGMARDVIEVKALPAPSVTDSVPAEPDVIEAESE
mgnify:CR=1 FL=1